MTTGSKPIEGELLAKINAITADVDIFNPDARMAARSLFEAQEKMWRLVPEITRALTKATDTDGGGVR